MPCESLEQFRMGAGRRLARKLCAALSGDIFDDGEGMTILVNRKQPLEQVGVRTSIHDIHCDPTAVTPAETAGVPVHCTEHLLQRTS